MAGKSLNTFGQWIHSITFFKGFSGFKTTCELLGFSHQGWCQEELDAIP